MKTTIVQLFLVLLAAAWAASSYAASQPKKRNWRWPTVTSPSLRIATGAKQPIARAPSVATVITAEDIAAIGAADIDEVLETVPGLHVSRSPLATTRSIPYAASTPSTIRRC